MNPREQKTADIQAYLHAGFTLIPLRGKIPVDKDWTHTPPDKYGVTELQGSNYGVALHAGDLVVDIDPRNFAAGDDPVKRLETDIGCPLVSFTVATGGGGEHRYFSKPADLAIVNSLRAYPGIEFKSVGRQVVGPGSVHPESGKTYAVTNGAPTAVNEAPGKLLALIVRRTHNAEFESSQGTGEYRDDAETRDRYISYLKSQAEPSVEGRNGDANAFKVACHGRDLALPPAVTWELMLGHWNGRCVPPWEPGELKSKVVNAYHFASRPLGGAHPAADFRGKALPPSPAPAKSAAVGVLPHLVTPTKEEDIAWDTNASGTPKKTFMNLLNYLRMPRGGLYRVFGYNEFTKEVEITNPAPWHQGTLPRYPAVSDGDIILLKAHLADRHNFECEVSMLREAIYVNAFANRFHPVREYLLSLQWDGVKRLDTWLKDFGGCEDTEYTRAISRKVLCAAVMRAFNPGVKFDHVLVLEGNQGIGKSGICKILGGDWFGDFPLDPHKADSIQLMQGKWIVELAELEFTRRAENDAIKAFITRRVDKARLAYGHLAMEFPRQSIFIATKNPEADGTYLNFDSENRRWWPVWLNPPHGVVDFAALKAVRNQLFAEAVVKTRTAPGERLDMETEDLRFMAKKVVDQRHAPHAWTERIQTWISGIPKERDFLTAREVYVEALGGLDIKFDRRVTVALAGILRAMDWQPKTKRADNGMIIWGYHKVSLESVPEIADFLGL